MTTARMDIQVYRQPLWGTLDTVSRNCLIAAAVFGVLVIIAVFVAPAPPVREASIQEMPARFARLILERPKAAPQVKAPAPASTYEAPQQEITKAAPPEPAAARPKPRPAARQQTPKVAQDRGQQGREKANTEVVQNLAAVSGSLDKVLGELSAALPASQSADPAAAKPARRGRRNVRSGRGSTQVTSVASVTDLAQADVSGSALSNEGVSIANITDIANEGGGSAGGGAGGSGTSAVGGSGGTGGELRSSKSLLEVVRRYAPGIQFCYENELKKSPGLRGKQVVSLTVEPDGTVSNVLMVEDSLQAPAVTDCVMAQMRGWKFPAIAQGTVTFKTPFVFTPPE